MIPVGKLRSYWCRSLARTRVLLDALPIRASLCGMATSKPTAPTRRAVLYVRVSTSDRGQTVENQLQPLQEAAGRLGRTMSATRASVAPGGATSGLGRMLCLKGVARREFDIVAAWWVVQARGCLRPNLDPQS